MCNRMHGVNIASHTFPQVSSEERMTQCHVDCMNCIKTWTDWRPSQARSDKINISLIFMNCLPIMQ